MTGVLGGMLRFLGGLGPNVVRTRDRFWIVVAQNAAGEERQVGLEFKVRYEAVAACERLQEDWAMSEPADFLKRHELPSSFDA
jgi:hypothetical protein